MINQILNKMGNVATDMGPEAEKETLPNFKHRSEHLTFFIDKAIAKLNMADENGTTYGEEEKKDLGKNIDQLVAQFYEHRRLGKRSTPEMAEAVSRLRYDINELKDYRYGNMFFTKEQGYALAADLILICDFVKIRFMDNKIPAYSKRGGFNPRPTTEAQAKASVTPIHGRVVMAPVPGTSNVSPEIPNTPITIETPPTREEIPVEAYNDIDQYDK